MARIEEFAFEGHCCSQTSEQTHGVELACRVCPTTMFVEDGSPQLILDAIADHTHMTEESARPCQRRIARREEMLSLSGRRIF